MESLDLVFVCGDQEAGWEELQDSRGEDEQEETPALPKKSYPCPIPLLSSKETSTEPTAVRARS